MATVFILLYGLSFIGGLFLTFVWGRVAFRGFRSARRDGGKLDQFCMIGVGLCIGAVANAVMFGTRTVTSAIFGIEPAVLAQSGVGFIAFSLLGLAVSKGILMWAHDPTHRSVSWRGFAILSVLWVLTAPFWATRGL